MILMYTRDFSVVRNGTSCSAYDKGVHMVYGKIQMYDS